MCTGGLMIRGYMAVDHGWFHGFLLQESRPLCEQNTKHL